MRKLLSPMFLIAVLAACDSSATAPEPAAPEFDAPVTAAACVPMHGTDRVQCDTKEEAIIGAILTDGTYGSAGSNGKWWYLPGLCVEDCT